ncbi:MAG: dihydroorotate dehydrogenase-like protein [Bacteroidota bacterium]|nr:dihydroorotate dehydrogenase-like protein [Bacteroidota bacterium]
MADLRTTFMGIELKNPIIVGANHMVSNMDYLKRFEDSGAAAIVYKTLFEEQISLEKIQFQNEWNQYDERGAEMIQIHPKIEHSGPAEHLFNLSRAKSALGIPLFASLNCVYQETWLEYAKEISKTGVDGLEINFFAVPKDLQSDGSLIEDMRVNILREIKRAVNIPVSVKLSFFYTNPLNMVFKLADAGADAFILFNRLFEPEIDIESQTHVSTIRLSNEGDYRLSLRYIGMLYKNIKPSLCGSSGVYHGSDVVKLMLAGADTVQVVSALFKHKPEHIKTMLEDVNNWMERKNYATIDEFKGKLAKVNTKDPFVYKRAQYIDIILRSEEFLRGNALV